MCLVGKTQYHQKQSYAKNWYPLFIRNPYLCTADTAALPTPQVLVNSQLGIESPSLSGRSGSLFCSKGMSMVLHFPDDALLGIMAALDEDTLAHCSRVQTLALTLGELMGLTPAELLDLNRGAYLHDVGKQYLPERILRKKAPLTPQEWELIELHPRWGYGLAEAWGLSPGVNRIILEHHLWANRQGGYPQELMGSKPGLLTQIVTVADVVDAMSSHRPYRQALDLAVGLEYLEEHAGTKFNSDIVASFKAEIYPFLRKSG